MSRCDSFFPFDAGTIRSKSLSLFRPVRCTNHAQILVVSEFWM